MKVFKNLEIEVPPEKSAEFIAALECNLPTGWTRDEEAEAHSVALGARGNIYIVCDSEGSRKSALVALVPKEGSGYYVSNIVPREVGSLTYEQYNQILDDFADNCVTPVATSMGLAMDWSSDTETIEDWVGADTAEKLKRFSGSANKSTGSAHPMDEKRWYDFIVAVVTNNDSLDSSTLARWLVEEEGWPDDMAQRLSTEYEQGVSLLKHYLRRRT